MFSNFAKLIFFAFVVLFGVHFLMNLLCNKYDLFSYTSYLLSKRDKPSRGLRFGMDFATKPVAKIAAQNLLFQNDHNDIIYKRLIFRNQCAFQQCH